MKVQFYSIISYQQMNDTHQPSLYYQQLKGQILIIKKQRERQNDLKILSLWRDKRSRFFNQYLKVKELPLQVPRKQRQNIQKYFEERKLKQIKQGCSRMTKECLPLCLILQNKITHLKVISIEYHLKQNKQDKEKYRYSITALSLLKIVQQNPFLVELFLKGILVENFQQILTQIRRVKSINQAAKGERNYQSQLQHFNHNKSLNLAINTILSYSISKQEQTLSLIDDLTFFAQSIHVLSDITVQIKLGKLYHIDEWENTLKNLWKCLRQISKINIQIYGYNYDQSIEEQQVQIIRATLFGGLACFTGITQLSFQDLAFSYQLPTFDFIALGQNLHTTFEKNPITRLKLHNCINFPGLSSLSNIQSVDLNNISFWRDLNFMNNVIQASSNLKYIKQCSLMEQQWQIDEQLFNQLQSLIIIGCNAISLDNICAESHSNITNLCIIKSSIGNLQCLSLIFPKLSALTCLQLFDINFSHQLLSAIPSPYLDEPAILSNHMFENRSIEEVDLKWPNLRNLQLRSCNRVNQHVWALCQFKGLMELSVDRKMLGLGCQILQLFQLRGIQVKL